MKVFPEQAKQELRMLRRLSTPEKVQDFLDTLPANFERGGDTCRSPLAALRHQEAHCMEGALIAAAAFWYYGAKPLLLDLKTSSEDESHVIALFRRGKYWGAVSKTNHAVLRYRDPVFRTVRELALSYFNEYFLDSGKKTLRSYAGPFDLRRFGADWLTSDKNQWKLVDAIDATKHYPLVPAGTKLRRADTIEIKAGKLTEWH